MKFILTFLLLFISLVSFGQQPDLVKLKLKSGEEYQVNIEEIERSRVNIITQSGKKSVVYAFDIESIDGIPYKQFYEEKGEYFNNYKPSNQQYPQGNSELKIFPNENGFVTYSDVVYLDSSYSRKLLFENAERWFVDQYRSAQDVIQYKNIDQGEMIGKGIIQSNWKYGGNLMSTQVTVYHTVKLYFKDGRYKYSFSDFTDECISSGSSSSPRIITDSIVYKEKGFGHKIINDMWIDVKTRTSKEVDLMISSLKSEMEKETTTEEW